MSYRTHGICPLAFASALLVACTTSQHESLSATRNADRDMIAAFADLPDGSQVRPVHGVIEITTALSGPGRFEEALAKAADRDMENDVVIARYHGVAMRRNNPVHEFRSEINIAIVQLLDDERSGEMRRADLASAFIEYDAGGNMVSALVGEYRFSADGEAWHASHRQQVLGGDAIRFIEQHLDPAMLERGFIGCRATPSLARPALASRCGKTTFQIQTGRPDRSGR